MEVRKVMVGDSQKLISESYGQVKRIEDKTEINTTACHSLCL